MQWIAMMTMLIDHIGIVWFDDQPIYRVIGRMAFPIYAFYVVQGMQLTSNRRAYVIRLGVLAAVSQAPFTLLFDTYSVNVIGTFFVCVLGMYGFTRESSAWWMRWVSLGLSAVILISYPFDYGLYALLLMLIYRYARGVTMLVGHIFLNIGFVLAMLHAVVQLWSFLPSMIFAVQSGRIAEFVRHHRAPKWFWRAFYPGHLLTLWLLSQTSIF